MTILSDLPQADPEATAQQPLETAMPSAPPLHSDIIGMLGPDDGPLSRDGDIGGSELNAAVDDPFIQDLSARAWSPANAPRPVELFRPSVENMHFSLPTTSPSLDVSGHDDQSTADAEHRESLPEDYGLLNDAFAQV